MSNRYSNDTWNVEACNLLKGWWEIDGLVSFDIAKKFKELGYPITRNAVIGKAYRMKLVAPKKKDELLRQKSRERFQILNPAKAKAVIRAANGHAALKQVLINGKKYHPDRLERLSMPNDQPDNDNTATLIAGLGHDMCRAIIGYQNGMLEKAVYCGKPTVSSVSSLGEKMTSWCTKHKALYMTMPRSSAR